MNAKSEMIEYAKQENEIDIIQLLIDLKQRWKLIVLVTIFGIVLSAAFALMKDKIYRVSVIVNLPAKHVVTSVNFNGLYEYDTQSLFKMYFDKLRSEESLKRFVFDKGYLNRLYQKDGEELENQDVLFSKFSRSFSIEVIEPKPHSKQGEELMKPISILMSLEGKDELLIVELLNAYVNFTNELMFSELVNYQKMEREVKLADLNQQLISLKDKEKMEREFRIAKLEAEIKVKIDTLKQQKQIVIEKAKLDRQVEIALLKEANERKLNELQQRKDLLLSKAAKDRATAITKAQEALIIATNLNIVHPTRLENMGEDNSNSMDQKTNITLSNEQSLPLYLMGSNYLKTYIKTLNERQNEASFLDEINQIESDIAKVRDDQLVKSKLARASDEPYLLELNTINSQINELENDKTLEELKIRESDELYIEQWPTIVDEINGLKSISMTFTGLKAYSLKKAALRTGKAIKPNRPMYVMIGASIAFLLALILSFILIVIDRRRV